MWRNVIGPESGWRSKANTKFRNTTKVKTHLKNIQTSLEIECKGETQASFQQCSILLTDSEGRHYLMVEMCPTQLRCQSPLGKTTPDFTNTAETVFKSRNKQRIKAKEKNRTYVQNENRMSGR